MAVTREDIESKLTENGSRAEGDLDRELIESCARAFGDSPSDRLARNAVTNQNLHKIALNRDVVVDLNEVSFSHKLDDWGATNQRRTGRCWLFAGLNLLRPLAMEELNVDEFEFSQNYFFFWDKFEKSNYFLEAIIETAELELTSRMLHWLLAELVPDGGQWHMFANLVEKYGLIPKSAMPESNSSKSSRRMNSILRFKLREFARDLRDLAGGGAGRRELDERKSEMMEVVYRILAIHLGEPPQSFEWQWRDKDDEFHRAGELTPQEFREEYVDFDFDDYVCLINAPTDDKPFEQTFTVQYLGNVVGGKPVKYLNVSNDEMKRAAVRSITDGEEPVWHGCHSSPQMQRKIGIWDEQTYDYESVYRTELDLDKAERLNYGQSQMTHAMVFTGVDLDGDGEVRRWRVENSWGDNVGEDGFFVMNDNWFDEYMFEVVVNKDYLPEHLIEANQQEPTVLPPWDPMGALAE